VTARRAAQNQSAIDGPAKGSVTGSIAALYVDGSTQTFDYNRGRYHRPVGRLADDLPASDKKTSDTLSFDSTLARAGQG